jgi:hypothetical protein
MAVTKMICPECKKTLKPSKPLPEGKKVTCPKCGANFTAKEPPPDPAARHKASAPARPTAAKQARQASKPIRPIEQRRRELDEDEDEEEEGGVYGVIHQGEQEGLEIKYTPDTSVKDLRGPAQAMVIQPSNYLMLAGILGFFGWLGFMVIVLIPIIFPLHDKTDDKNKQQAVQASPPGGPGGGTGGAGGAGDAAKAKAGNSSSFFHIWGINFADLAESEWYWVVLSVLGFGVGMIYSGVVAMGGVLMQNLESRRMAMVAAVLAVIPVNCLGLVFLVAMILKVLLDETVLMGPSALVCVLSAAAGLGAIYTLMRPEVVAGFTYKAD